MSQTNTTINICKNQDQISGRGERGRRGPNGSGRGDCCNGRENNSIAKYPFEGKMKDGPVSKLTITKTGHRPSQLERLVTLFLYYAQIRISKALMRSFVLDITQSKTTSCRLIRTQTCSLPHTMHKLALSTQTMMLFSIFHDIFQLYFQSYFQLHVTRVRRSVYISLCEETFKMIIKN